MKTARQSLAVLAILIVLVGTAQTGVVAADSHTSVEVTVVDAEDTDEDGASQAVTLRIRADTKFQGDQSLTNPEAEPYFRLFVDGERVKEDTMGRDATVEKSDTYETTITLAASDVPNFESGESTVRVELWDRDPFDDDRAAADAVAVELEAPDEDRAIRPRAVEGITQLSGMYTTYSTETLNPQFWRGKSQESAERVAEIGLDQLTPGPMDVLTTVAGHGELATSLLDLTEQQIYLFASLRTGRTATLLSMAQQENTELRNKLDELAENTRELEATTVTAERQRILEERKTILRETFQENTEYTRETRHVVQRGQRWGTLDVCAPTSFFGWICDNTVDVNDAEPVAEATGHLETVLRSDWHFTNAWLANSASYQSTEITGKDDSEPRPEITDVEIDDAVTTGETFTVRVEAENRGADASMQTIAVSFPDGPNSGNVEVVDHNFDLDDPSTVAGGYLLSVDEGGQTLGAQYGTEEVQPVATLVEVGDEWAGGERRYVEFAVTVPESVSSDEVSVFVKSVARGDQWSSDPDVGETSMVDQQGEFVYDHTVTVQHDQDGDGIPDEEDAAPNSAEDLDGIEDDDGSPETDADDDGVPDATDDAPTISEDLDGVADHDGVPESDADGDGIGDGADECPLTPEDDDGPIDDDGCPDDATDTDGDGIPDADDAAPNSAEDLDGVEDDDGAPESDADGDGISGDEDEAPMDPDAGDGVEDGDDASQSDGEHGAEAENDTDSEAAADSADNQSWTGDADSTADRDADTTAGGDEDVTESCPVATPGASESSGSDECPTISGSEEGHTNGTTDDSTNLSENATNESVEGGESSDGNASVEAKESLQDDRSVLGNENDGSNETVEANESIRDNETVDKRAVDTDPDANATDGEPTVADGDAGNRTAERVAESADGGDDNDVVNDSAQTNATGEADSRAGDGNETDGDRVTVSENRTGTDGDTPEFGPENGSDEPSAASDGDGESDPTGERTLEILSGETDVHYRIYVDGEAEITQTDRAKAHNPDSISREDGLTVIDDYSSHDSDWDGDAYAIRGEIIRVELEGDGQLAIDGEPVDPRDIADDDVQPVDSTDASDEQTDQDGSGDADIDRGTDEPQNESPTNQQTTDQPTAGEDTGGESPEERTLELVSGETDLEYRVWVDGEAEITETARAKAHNPVSISREGGLTVIEDYSSHDSDWDGDAYVIRGEIVRIELQGDGELAIDGETVDPRDVAEEVDIQRPEATEEFTEERTLEILSGETDVDYRIYVDGEAEITQTDRAKAHNPESITREDGLTVIDDYSSHDSDWDGDAYLIRGEITRIELEGDAQLAIDGEPVGPHNLTDDVDVQNGA